jgi:hypothetical protein
MVWGANLTFIFAAAHGGGFLCQQWWLVIGLSLPLIRQSADRVVAGLRDLLPCTVTPHAHAFIHHTTILEFSQSILLINPTIPSIYTSIDHEQFLPYMSLIFLPINQLPVSNHHSRVIIPSSYYKKTLNRK